jgi:hypothetical protein
MCISVQGQSPSKSQASHIGDAPGVPDPRWLAVVVAAVVAVVSLVDYSGDVCRRKKYLFVKQISLKTKILNISLQIRKLIGKIT